MCSEEPLDDRVRELLADWEESGQRLTAEQLCPDDPMLRARLEREIRGQLAMDAELRGSASGVIARAPPGFKLLEHLREGGMGSVWRAWQFDPPREVALKMIRDAALATPVAQMRFAREVDVWARLEDPHIVRLYGTVRHEGMSYLAMELIRGKPLDQYCAGPALAGLSTRKRLRKILLILREVCLAVQYAHNQLVIHRDLKPSNILVSDDGEPHIVDFGLAKALDSADAPRGGSTSPSLASPPESEEPGGTSMNETSGALTQEGDRPGTLQFMSPEQASGQRELQGTQTDIYGIGAVLYLLLTGRPPHYDHGGRDATLARIASAPPPRPCQVAPDIRGEVEAMVLKAMAMKPEDRYGTAEAFADDISRYLDSRPLAAVRPSIPYRLRKSLVRYRFVSAAAAILICTAVVVWAEYVHHVHAEQARTLAEKKRADQTAAAAQRQLADIYVRNGVAQWEAGDPARANLWFTAALKIDADDSRRARADRVRIGVTLRQVPELIDAVRYSEMDPINSPGTARLHVVNDFDHRDFHVEILDPSGRQPIAPFIRHEGKICAAVFSPAGDRILTASHDYTACIWSATTGRPLTPPLRHEKEVECAAFSPDGKRAVTGSWDDRARVWDAQTGQAMPWEIMYLEFIISVAFSHDGSRILTGGYHGETRLWDASTGAMIGQPLKQAGEIIDVGFSPDDHTLMTSTRDGTVRLWNARTTQPSGAPLRHPDAVSRTAISDDGRTVTSFCGDGIKRTWRQVRAEYAGGRLLEHPDLVCSAAFDREGRAVTVSSELRVWDPATGKLVAPPLHLGGLGRAISDDGRRVATIDAHQRFQIWDVASGKPLTPIIDDPPCKDAFFNSDGSLLWTEVPGAGYVWDASTGRLISGPMNQPGDLYAAFSPDGRLVATGGDDASARVWDTRSGKLAGAVMRHDARVHFARFSPDGQRIVTSSWDRTARVWSKEGKPISPPLRHMGPVTDACFSPDGSVIATSSEDHTARLWDAVTFKPLCAPLRHDDTALGVRFSPDGSRVATWSFDRSARMWDARDGLPMTPPLRSPFAPRDAAFSPDGKWLLANGEGNAASLWDISADERPIDELVRLVELLSSEALDQTGAPVRLSPEEWRERWESLDSIRGRVSETSP